MSDHISQEIENSSNSTKNSKKKCPLARSIFKSGQTSATGATQYLLTTARVPRLPLVEKRDYIENWILSSAVHSSRKTLQKPYSPSKNITRDKRIAVSPIHGHKWKRAKGEAIAETNAKVQINEKSLINPEVKISSDAIDCNFSPPSTRRSSRRLNFTDNSSLPNPAEASKSNQIRDQEILQKNRCASSEIIENERAMSENFKNSPKIRDRVTCKFSWHRLTKTRPRRSLELDGICDKTREQELFYSSRDFPPSIISESIKNCITKGFDEDSPIDSQVNSPLRWNGYESLRKFAKCSDTLSLSSPIIDSERLIQSSSTSDIKDHFIQETCDDKISSVHFSPVTKYAKFSQDESPQRWDGYENESHNFSKFTDFVTSRSENDLIIHSDSMSDFQEQNFAKEGSALSPRSNEGQTGTSEKISETVSQPLSIIANKQLSAACISKTNAQYRSGISLSDGTSIKDIQTESPQRWNQNQVCESSKLPETVSLFTPLMEGCERTLIQSSSLNEPENKNIMENQKSGLVLHRAKRINDEVSQRSNNLSSRRLNKAKCPKGDLLSSPVENMDVESLTTMAPEEDIRIESDSDVTDPIENLQRDNSIRSASRRDRSGSCDSDETYCTNGNPVVHSPQEINFSLKASQMISHLTVNSHDNIRVLRSKSELISPTSSPLINVPQPSILHISTENVARNKAKKTKKAKKGSLLAKLQTLVSHQTASFQLWQYKMSRIEDKPSHFVKFGIIKRETRYGRHYLLGSVIEDLHNLLKNLNVSEERVTPIVSQDEKLLTLVVMPEISGTLKLRDVSTIRIYPPWQIIDRDKKALRIVYFDADPKSDEASLSKNRRVTKIDRILNNFECPCLLSPEIDRSCRMKFKNTKPSVMAAIFKNR